MTPDALTLTFAALADPTRRALLAQLSEGEATVKALAEPHDMTVAGISKHLKVLQTAGLISRGRDAQWRPCRLEAAALREAYDWVGGYKRHWDRSLDALEDYLKLMQGQTEGQS